MAAKSAKSYLDRYQELKKDKFNFMNLWQLIGKYVHQRKVNFTECHLPGEFLTADVFDSTAPKAARKMAQVMVGMIWQGGKSCRLKRPEALKETSENKDYFQRITQAVQAELDDDRNGLIQALGEDMFDQVTFGTAGIGCYEGSGEASLDFMSFGVDECTLDENARGQVDTMYCERIWNVRKTVQEYGIDNVSAQVRDWFNQSKMDEEVRVLWVIEPRDLLAGEMPGQGNKSMPWSSMHFEIKTQKILRKSGYQEMPVQWERMFKQRNEKYGRSPASDAMPDIFELNFTKEARVVATEKAGDPPIVVADDGVGGAGVIDTSAGGVIVANTKGRASSPQNPIYPLFEGINIPQLDKTVEELKQSIMEHFNMDRLLDFSSDREMTLGEAQIRENIRAQATMDMFSSQISRLRRILERAISILFRKGKMGVFPDSPEARAALELGLDEVIIIPEDVANLIRQGSDFYQIEFLTPASRLLKAEQAKGTVQLWDFAVNVASQTQSPDILQKLDPVASMEVLGDAWGAPEKVFRTEKQVKAIQAAQAQAAQEQAQMQQAQQAAEVAKTMSDANAQEQATA
jgi:hypothetical protein